MKIRLCDSHYQWLPVKVAAEEITLVGQEELRFCVHRTIERADRWTVTECASGTSFGGTEYLTKVAAIGAAQDRLDKQGVAVVRKAVALVLAEIKKKGKA